MNGLSLFFLVLTVLVIFRGWRRGLVGLIYGIAAWIFIAVFVMVANPPIYHYFMENEDIHDAVYERVYPYADSYVPQIAAQVDVPVRLADSVPAEYREILEGLKEKGIDPGDIAGAVGDSLKESAEDIRKAAVEVAAERVTSYLLKAVAVILSYLIAKIICLLVKLALNAVTAVGPIRSAVHVAGAAIGVVEAILYIWIILYVISLAQLTEWGAALYGQVEENPVLLFLYENNGLAVFLGNLL